MLGTRYALLTGVAALGLAVSLPALSCGDHAAKTEAAKAQPAAARTASSDTCAVKAVAPAVAPAAFAARSQAAMKQAAKDGRLVMVSVFNANATGEKSCPISAAKVAAGEAKSCPISAAKVAQASDQTAKACPVTAAKVTQAADKASGCCAKDGAIQATQARFVTLQVNPSDCAGSKAFAAKYAVKTYPTTLFLDAKGKEVHRVSGDLKPEALTAAMDTALTRAAKVASRG